MEVPGRHAYTRDHSRHSFSCKSGVNEASTMRREASRVSFLMCPFCVRGLLSVLTTGTPGVDATDDDHELLPGGSCRVCSGPSSSHVSVSARSARLGQSLSAAAAGQPTASRGRLRVLDEQAVGPARSPRSSADVPARLRELGLRAHRNLPVVAAGFRGHQPVTVTANALRGLILGPGALPKATRPRRRHPRARLGCRHRARVRAAGGADLQALRRLAVRTTGG